MMETCFDSHSSPKRLLCDVGSFDLDVLLKYFMPEKGKDAMDLPSQRVLMKLFLFHCLANTSDQTPLPLPLVTENNDTPLEEKKLQYRFRPTWGARQKRSNLGSSKPHSNSQLPTLNIKRKRFSQPTATADLELKDSLLQEEPEPEASVAPKIVPRLKIIPPKKPHHLGSSSASPIAIPNYSASLSLADMDSSSARLSIPKGQIRADLLTQEDQEQREPNSTSCKGMQVPLIEPSLADSTIILKKWKLGSGISYIFGSGWQTVAKKN
nr:b3 domain-containing protein [Quercus suber]